MRYGKRPDPTPAEIQAIIKAIQAGWSEEAHRWHPRGFVGDDRELFDSWDVPTVSISLPVDAQDRVTESLATDLCEVSFGSNS